MSSESTVAAVPAESAPWRTIDADRLLVGGGALLVASAAVSAVGPLSAVVGVGGIAACAPAAVVGLRDRLGQIVAGLAVFWVVYGALVGALPTDWSGLRAWVETEGRSLVVLGVIVASIGLQRPGTFLRLMRGVTAVVVVTTAISLPIWIIDRGGERLYIGFTTSHHVPGFLACGVIITLVAERRVVPDHRVRIGVVGLMFAATVTAGSRTALFAALVAVAFIVARRRGLKSLRIPLAVGLIAMVVAVAGSSRLRETGELVVTGEVFSDGWEVFTDGGAARALELSSSEAEANILLRFAIWSTAVDQFTTSPIIGIGRYRVNDTEPELSGWDGAVAVVTGGQRQHNDSEPHNLVLYMLSETGLVGLVWSATPFWLAWRRTRLRNSDDPGLAVDGEPARLTSRSANIFGGLIGLVSVGVLGTGAGLITCMMIFGGMAAWELERAPEPEEER